MDLSDDEGELNPVVRTESNIERSVSCPQATDDDNQPRVSE